MTRPGEQETLIQQVAATGKPVIVVTVHGGILSMDWTAGNVRTIVDALYPGEMGGDAVVSVLFGDVSPSGRTVTTWYPSAYQTARPLVTDMALAPHDDVPGITYLYYDGPVLWPFGWGLSYTTFRFDWAAGEGALSVDTVAFGTGAAAPPSFLVNVTNTGMVTSDVSVLAFFSAETPGEPLQELFDFQRTAGLAPGEMRTLRFSLPPAVAACVTSDGTQVVRAGTYAVRIGDTVATGNFVKTAVHLSGPDHELFSMPRIRQRYAAKHA